MLLAPLCVVTTQAQDSIVIVDAELSIPFGVAAGRVVAVADQFLFVDDTRPDQSFALRKSNIIRSSSDGDVLSIRTDSPVNSATEFSFRIDSDGSSDILSWLGDSGTPSVATTRTSSSGDAFAETRDERASGVNNLIGEYRVQHNHFLGECEGTLRITDEGIDFQSITVADHSRRWDMADVKEIAHANRDELRVAPLIGTEYLFDFTSERLMSDAEFRRLSDRVAGARLDLRR
jgi:hypothetical protein